MEATNEHMKLSAERFFGLARFRYALRNFLASSEQICGQAGVTTTQYQAMLAVACSAELFSIKQLAEQLLLKHHSAVQLVDRLSAAGLVRRVVSERDARVVLVSLTSKGEAEFEALAELHLAEMLRQGPRLSIALQLLRKQDNKNEFLKLTRRLDLIPPSVADLERLPSMSAIGAKRTLDRPGSNARFWGKADIRADNFCPTIFASALIKRACPAGPSRCPEP